MAINDVSSSTSVLDQYRSTSSTENTENELGKNAFLELMVAQLNNQNPLEPQDNQAFVAQLAQFSSVEGLDNLNSTAEQMMSEFTSNAALQASSLVGQSVIVEGNDTGLLTTGGVVSGYTDLEASNSDMVLTIEDASGQTLEQIPLGNREAGAMSVRWDGYNLMVDGDIVEQDRAAMNLEQYYYDDDGEIVVDDNGDPVLRAYPPGQYVFRLNSMEGGQSQETVMEMSSRADSVTMGSNGTVTLNLTGGQRAGLDEVKQILDA